MNNEPESTCPKCGAHVPEDAPQGLCPRCVLAGAATAPGTSTPSPRDTPPPTVEQVAECFPDLEILELVGSGGMGAVYKARQPKLDRLVALKVLSHDLAEDPAFAERFNREACMLARLSHPNIVTVFDFGTNAPFCYLLMEYVDGVNLRQAMQEGGFTAADSLALVRDICNALQFAHEEGILHRDIKPENILLDARGRVKIADFGIAKLIGHDSDRWVTLTAQGASLGSPHYMAPEQIKNPEEVDQRADIYSLGVVFYELLTGELPIGRFAPPSQTGSGDSRIDEVVMRTLEKERRLRYQTAGEVRTSVEAITRSGQAGGGSPHEEPAAGDAPAPPTPPGGSAKLSTASAILTGISLLALALAVLSPLALHYFLNTGGGRSGVGLPLIILVLLVLMVAGIPAILGFILGAIALGRIRASGAAGRGLGRAMFGTLTWPLLLLITLTSIGTGMGLVGVFGPGLLWFVGATAITMVVGAVFLLAVRRWVLGGPGGMSWLLGPHTAIAAGIVLIPTLLVLVTGGMLWMVPMESDPQTPRPVIESTTGARSSMPSVDPEPGFE